MPQVNEFSWFFSYFMIWILMFSFLLNINYVFQLCKKVDSMILKFDYHFLLN